MAADRVTNSVLEFDYTWNKNLQILHIRGIAQYALYNFTIYLLTYLRGHSPMPPWLRHCRWSKFVRPQVRALIVRKPVKLVVLSRCRLEIIHANGR